MIQHILSHKTIKIYFNILMIRLQYNDILIQNKLTYMQIQLQKYLFPVSIMKLMYIFYKFFKLIFISIYYFFLYFISFFFISIQYKKNTHINDKILNKLESAHFF